MTIHEKFIVEAYLLSRVNIAQWDKFMIALKNNTTDLMEAAVMQQSPEAVGMAKQALIFYQGMANIETTYGKIKDKK